MSCEPRTFEGLFSRLGQLYDRIIYGRLPPPVKTLFGVAAERIVREPTLTGRKKFLKNLSANVPAEAPM